MPSPPKRKWNAHDPRLRSHTYLDLDDTRRFPGGTVDNVREIRLVPPESVARKYRTLPITLLEYPSIEILTIEDKGYRGHETAFLKECLRDSIQYLNLEEADFSLWADVGAFIQGFANLTDLVFPDKANYPDVPSTLR